MVGGISAAMGGLSASTLRFDRAVERLGAATAEGGGSGAAIAAGASATTDAMVQMAVERLGAATAEGGGSGAAIAGGASATTDAMVQMAVARFSFMASLRAASATNEMLAKTLKLSDHG